MLTAIITFETKLFFNRELQIAIRGKGSRK